MLRHPAPSAPRRRAVSVWAVCAVAYLIAITSRTALSATGLAAGERFEIGADELAAFGVLQLAVYAACQIPAGMLIDRLGGRATLVGGVGVIALSQAALALGTDFETLLIARGASGLGDAFVFPSAVRLVAIAVSPAWVATFTQALGTVGAFGSVLSSTPLLRLVGGAGWETAYLTTGACSGGVALAAAILLGRMGADRSRVAGGETLRSVLRGSLVAVRLPGTRLAYWAHFSTPSVGQVFSVAWGVPFLTAGAGLDPDGLSLFMVLSFIAGAVAGPVIGRVADRRPDRRVPIVLISIAVQAVGWTLALAWPSPVPLAALLPLAVALAVGGASSILAFDLARSTVPAPVAARANGIVNTAGFTAALLGIAVVGTILSALGVPETRDYTIDAFRLAFLPLTAIWVVGGIGVIRASRAVSPGRDGDDAAA